MTVISRSGTPLGAGIGEYGRYGTLFVFLALRDIRLRYRQTMLGVVWAVLQPLLPMLIFAAVFARLLGVETGDVPYPLFVFSGLAPWMFVANAVTAASPAFVNNFTLLNKVYFPRAILPGAAVAATALDGVVAVAAVLALSIWYGFTPALSWLLLPLVGAVAMLLAMGAGLAAASLTAVFRDMKNVVPFLVQVWMYASPVLYPMHLFPRRLRAAAGFNPMAGVLEAFRACLFHVAPDWTIIAQSAAATVVLAGVAVWLFHSLEADLAERV